ncbi:hypothetical protein UlMin_014170 [Ulmus minor]
MDTDFELQVKRSKIKQEEDQLSNGMENLPREIVFDILSKLPISSLVQFKYVCRSWRFLAQDPHLVEFYNTRSVENNPCLIFHCDFPIRNQLYFVDFDANNNEKEVVKKIQTPFCASMPEFDVVGSCNGLLCLSDSLYNDALYVYNPFNRDYRELPKTVQYPNQETVFGFGFHPGTKEYKVVKIIYYRKGNRGYKNRFRFSSPLSEVLVFTLGSSTWRSLGRVAYYLHQWPAQVLVHGRLHWVTWPRRHRTGRNLISFDLADEQFREVPKPDVGLRRCDYHIGVISGCLCAAFYFSYGKLEIWVMKEYEVKESWVKAFTIGSHMPKAVKQDANQSFNISKIAVKGRLVRILCVLSSGEILLEYKNRALVVYDPKTGKFKDLVFQGMPNWFQTIVHVGNLNHIDTLIGI